MTRRTKDPTAWFDHKRHGWLLGPSVPLLACVSLAAYLVAPHTAWCWVLPALIFLVLPALDALIGTDNRNVPESAVAALEADRYYLGLVIAHLPLQGLTLLLGAACADSAGLGSAAWWGATLTVGAVNGLGINAAHELGHKHQPALRRLAVMALVPSGYGHFQVEHHQNHHRWVATPQDTASARMGESFWHFLPRSVLGGVRAALRLERERLTRIGRSPFSLRNRVINAWLMTTLLFLLLMGGFGPSALPFLLIQAAYAITLLEVINYLEHYGLLRARDADGRYERCGSEHSWNSNHVVGNLMLYNLQRHADHHAHPARSYPSLRHFATSPQLPAGYATMLMLAYLPPLWFALMDPRLARHCAGDLSRAHVDASARGRAERLFQRARLE
jgi:alkane 1-monooxygenase